MAELKRTFTGGKMDKDTDERIVQNGLYREALNISIATSEDSDVGAAQNILGNVRVTDVIQHMSLSEGQPLEEAGTNDGDEFFSGDNYHVGAVVDLQTDKLYRFVHTDKPTAMKMDRIIEFDTSKKMSASWDQKEAAVFVDIFYVKGEIDYYTDECADPNSIGNTSIIKFADTSDFTNQVRWGMKVVINYEEATVINVNYSTKEITLDKILSLPNQIAINESLVTSWAEFYGDRNLNFGDTTNGIRKITGINIVDGMIFWTDNVSEPKKINIERSKDGCDSAKWASETGRGNQKINDFTQHTLLVVEDNIRFDNVIDETSCISEENCTDPLALNYNAGAIFDCNGDYINSTEPVYTQAAGWDLCCIFQVDGCTDSNACNYDPSANNDDGSCLYIEGCTDPLACNFNDQAECPSIIAENTTCIYEGCTEGCTDPLALNYGCTSGDMTGTPPWSDNGATTDPNATPDSPCGNEGIINTDDGSCVYPVVWQWDEGCGCDYVPYGGEKYSWFWDEIECETAPENTGIIGGPCCVAAEYRVFGCTDSNAVNYISGDVCPCDDSSGAGGVGCDNNTGGDCTGPGNNECCQYTISGCTDNTATNYVSNATIDDGSCYYAGCTDPRSCNYDALATVDDGSCVLTYGCMDPFASNYDPNDIFCSDCSNTAPVSGYGDTSCCTYDPSWSCIAEGAYGVGCVELSDGTGSYTSLSTCQNNCINVTWDCGAAGCYDPGTGNGAFADQAVCEANCNPPPPPEVSYNCDGYGNCADPGDGSGVHKGSTALEDCQGVCFTPSWDCDASTSYVCTENFTGTGGFAENTCAGGCSAPVINYACNAIGLDENTGIGYQACEENIGGQFSSLQECEEAVALGTNGCTLLIVNNWYCGGGALGCVEDVTGVLGIYHNEEQCYIHSACPDPSPGNPIQWEFTPGSGCTNTATESANNVDYFETQAECELFRPEIGCMDEKSWSYNFYATHSAVVEPRKACYYPGPNAEVNIGVNQQFSIPPGGNGGGYNARSLISTNTNHQTITSTSTNPLPANGNSWVYSGMTPISGSCSTDSSGAEFCQYVISSNYNNLYDTAINTDTDWFYGAPNYAVGVADVAIAAGADSITGTNSGDGPEDWYTQQSLADDHCGCTYYDVTQPVFYANNTKGYMPNVGVATYPMGCSQYPNSPADGNLNNTTLGEAWNVGNVIGWPSITPCI